MKDINTRKYGFKERRRVANSKELLAVIRKKCVQCCEKKYYKIDACNCTWCPLNPYRHGVMPVEETKPKKNPNIDLFFK